MMRRLLPVNFALSALLFAACVTINVYFPAAAAEKAADQIIDKVTGSSVPQSDTAPPKDPGKTPAGSQRRDSAAPSIVVAALGRALELLVPAAYAQAPANLDIETPEIRAITASMHDRFGQLEKFFESGVVGLTADGRVEIRDGGSVALADRALIKRLVAEDNKDRDTLYAEIAKANGHPEWTPDIRKTFARRWVERGAKPGWFYQDASGAWKQK
jgi:uncharacterized protein YdbL (DUF1318 family)